MKAEKLASWPGLTYQNASKAYPKTDETLKIHMVQVHQGIRSTKPNPTRTKYKQPEANILPRDTTPPQELHIKVEHIRKFYTDDTGRFLVRSRSGNQYTMIAYHCDSNAIIAAPFKSFTNRHRLLAYGSIMQRLKDRNMLVDLHILDNEASTE